MNNGRMTFRFDGKDEGRRSEAADRRTVRINGTVPENKDKNKDKDKLLYEENGTHLEPRPLRPDEYIVELPQVKSLRTAEVSYMHSKRSSRWSPDLRADDDELEQPYTVPPASRNLWDQSSRKDSPPLYGESYGQDEDEADRHSPLLDDDLDEGAGGYGASGSYGGGFGGAYRTRHPSYWWKFALAITGALGTGILLGYAALSFIGGGPAGTAKEAGSGAVQTGTAQGQNSAGGNAGADITGVPAAQSGEAAAALLPVQVAAQSYYLLQYGVFSTPAGAEQAKQELLAAGLAAGLDPADGNRVYAGMSPDREQAKLLSSSLKNQGIALYVRELALPAVKQVRYSGSPEAVDRYFTVSAQLLNELSSLSASLLSGASAGSGTAAVSDLHMQWLQAAKSLEPGLSPEGQSLASGLEQSMSQGIAALNEYGKNKAEGLLWEVQEAMMSFLTGQRSLLSSISQ